MLSCDSPEMIYSTLLAIKTLSGPSIYVNLPFLQDMVPSEECMKILLHTKLVENKRAF